MIKKIQAELILLLLILLSVLISYSFDSGLYNFFSNINYGFGGVYLKDFFIKLTNLGDSLWYFIIFITTYLVSILVYKFKLISFSKYLYLKNFSSFGFLSLAAVGLVTQILKHIIGRPRPNHTNFVDGFSFNFLTTNSNFHSFPSGHASTIIVITLIASIIIPKLKIFFYSCGLLIAISRVVVGAHFTTDVIAGILVALIVFKITNMYLKHRFPKIESSHLKIHNLSIYSNTLVILFTLSTLITVGSFFDVYFSSLFYYGNSQFLLQTPDIISIIFRKFFLPLLLLYIFVLPIINKIIPIQIIYFKFDFSFRDIICIWLSGLLTLLILVNVLLKGFWGRVRPNDILQFGGDGVFTPWFKFGESCASNCSFVSGDSSVGFMLIVFYFITKNNIYCYLSLICGGLLGLIRVIAGGHFLSDIIFSNLVVYLSVGLFFMFLKKNYDK